MALLSRKHSTSEIFTLVIPCDGIFAVALCRGSHLRQISRESKYQIPQVDADGATI